MDQVLMQKGDLKGHSACRRALVIECNRWLSQELRRPIRLLASRIVRRDAFASMCGEDHPCTSAEDDLIRMSLSDIGGSLAEAGSRFGSVVVERSFMLLLQEAVAAESKDREDPDDDPPAGSRLHDVPNHGLFEKRELR